MSIAVSSIRPFLPSALAGAGAVLLCLAASRIGVQESALTLLALALAVLAARQTRIGGGFSRVGRARLQPQVAMPGGAAWCSGDPMASNRLQPAPAPSRPMGPPDTGGRRASLFRRIGR